MHFYILPFQNPKKKYRYEYVKKFSCLFYSNNHFVAFKDTIYPETLKLGLSKCGLTYSDIF